MKKISHLSQGDKKSLLLSGRDFLFGEISMEELLNGICYVVFVFTDGTRQTVHTTLNNQILKTYGVTPKPEMVYDLDHAEYVRIRRDAVSVDVTTEKPKVEEALNHFANRFI